MMIISSLPYILKAVDLIFIVSNMIYTRKSMNAVKLSIK